VTERILDLAAAAKIARRVNLDDVYVATISARRYDVEPNQELTPILTDSYECTQVNNQLKVVCSHGLKAASGSTPIADIHVDLNLIYEIVGEEPIDHKDLAGFADANGAYHSWPFIREILNTLTLKMGLPAFILPALIVNSKPPVLRKDRE
jgi:hypothetical protein